MKENKMKATIHGIFPTPVYITKLSREFTEKEIKFIEKNKSDIYKNKGNITSKNTYIINSKPFNNIKKELNEIILNYFNTVICSKDNIEPYITQSWLNYTEETQYHHTHEHPNSLVSGVLYINADKNNDKINFFSNKYKMIRPQIKEYNFYNSETWWFPVETSQVILFPSSLTHCVEVKKGNNTRISLAFNVFIKGKVGDNLSLTELIL